MDDDESEEITKTEIPPPLKAIIFETDMTSNISEIRKPDLSTRILSPPKRLHNSTPRRPKITHRTLQKKDAESQTEEKTFSERQLNKKIKEVRIF